MSCFSFRKLATGGFYEELFSDITNCEICFEPLEQRKPRTLSCLHVFCEDCLQHLLDDAKAKNPQTPDSIRCTVCSQTTQVPGGSSASLPLSFYLLKVQNVIKELDERHKLYTISVIDDPTLLCQIKIGRWINDMEYQDNGQLIVCMCKGLEIYDDNGDKIDHYLSHNCKPVGDVGLWGMSVGRNVGNIVVTDTNHPGYLHVYDTAGASWRYNRCRVCQGPSRVGVTSDGCYIVYSYVNSKLYKYTYRCVELWSIDTSRDGGCIMFMLMTMIRYLFVSTIMLLFMIKMVNKYHHYNQQIERWSQQVYLLIKINKSLFLI
ncbi:hypothetical protein LSH36_887g02010 [Paralvinella palmiformis]|uniref:RING-type domain-containing protein n=1 Tax=Paralvinella palmiformis TaxID=53620 RepID=A0AAD9MT97_9ANNE|nr:hypothetical protein LSH36_887g02010 [Paralvinella palmiformis]